ncbi:hypothetical protein [Pseudonocardia sp. GCM10023141]|uniref:hypothetical protein n=1 Tax=Pseudonocardia sp. GCM10023141 TaxID=3252653 RepID=UPI00360C73EF
MSYERTTMTAAAPTVVPAGPGVVSRIAASGVPVELTLPAALGELRWYGNARFLGPRTARQFFLAPAGEHRLIPTHVLPGARESRVPMRGFDAVVYEAPDRSDSALVLAGPHHEATTWFGGPAPDAAGLNALLTSFRFTDAAQGATLVPMSDLLVRQTDVSIIGRSPRSVLVARRAVEALPTLPDWAGLRMAGGEMWRAGRVLDPRSAALVKGTPHEWRYLVAGPTAAMDVVFLGPESGRPPLALDDAAVVEALGALAGRWGA